eukprot:CAMPEP_0180141356 /NCGR_PEP_ID=MMETSP0986-20121125/14845_1 /TAXON_ID=697907 /ORGANISM="non described non described, Strain CCMP2293" /LENGTH=109 /DNA_ID=CAMNT_0022084165 /DNA_START=92 /DNA_END=418 /DNA_ORIENTATION=+
MRRSWLPFWPGCASAAHPASGDVTLRKPSCSVSTVTNVNPASFPTTAESAEASIRSSSPLTLVTFHRPLLSAPAATTTAATRDGAVNRGARGGGGAGAGAARARSAASS